MHQGLKKKQPGATADGGSARPRGNATPAGGGVDSAPDVTPRRQLPAAMAGGVDAAGAGAQRAQHKRELLAEDPRGAAPKTVEGLLAEIGRDARRAGRGAADVAPAAAGGGGGGGRGRDAIKAAIKVRRAYLTSPLHPSLPSFRLVEGVVRGVRVAWCVLFDFLVWLVRCGRSPKINPVLKTCGHPHP
jgi:hypothetical protein